ncbi:hypothetical protein J2Z69_000665 [Paenibacillus shirakamiensis]|uniref:Uncharacterized protein n=1 Tax=Paenibacillus shirakamiensis TaxID=1265935 RepID=A0ABS4JFB0_9BACL|nr:hypothetical protein [Paenibacillus shirakamiensis]MBP1999646.1 hypothetical protein [Paenibacillus shirakamiensis]
MSDVPDFPIGFGYNNQWYAISTTDVIDVIEFLKLEEVQLSNWETGIKAANQGYYFLSPAIKGWIMIVNSRMPDISVDSKHNPIETTKRLSEKYGQAFYFGTHRVVEYHAWIKAVEGQIKRAYCFVGEAGETLLNEGKLTPEEIHHGLLYTELDVDDPLLPNEESVIQLAKAWSIDPQMQGKEYDLGIGFIGRIHVTKP